MVSVRFVIIKWTVTQFHHNENLVFINRFIYYFGAHESVQGMLG